MINHAITVIALRLSGTFARTLILRKVKPLAFIGKTLKKYVKKSLKYHTFMKTHFNTFSFRLNNLFLMCKLTHRFFSSDSANFENLKDVIAAAQLETNGTSF